MLQRQLKASAYYASLAGIKMGVAMTDAGFVVEVSGYSSRLQNAVDGTNLGSAVIP